MKRTLLLTKPGMTHTTDNTQGRVQWSSLEKHGGRRPLEEAPVSSSCCVLATATGSIPGDGALLPVIVHVYGDSMGTGSTWLAMLHWQTSGSGQ